MAKVPERIALPGPAPAAPGAVVTPRVSLPAAAAAETRPVLETLSNKELVAQIISSATQLAKKEVELAKTELKADIKREVAMAKGLGVAGLCALLAVNMMLVAIALALGNWMPEWAAALVVTAVVLAVGTVAGLVGWKKRVKEPMQATRRTVMDDVAWAKGRIA